MCIYKYLRSSRVKFDFYAKLPSRRRSSTIPLQYNYRPSDGTSNRNALTPNNRQLVTPILCRRDNPAKNF